MAKIKNLPIALRPREKLVQLGPSALQNSELLSIILGIGTRKEDVLEIAEKIFPIYSQVISFSRMNPNEISKELDIPITYACKLLAIFEIAKRIYGNEYVFIHSPKEVYERYKGIESYSKEHLIGIYLNARSEIIHEETLSIGTVNESLISIKEVLQPGVMKSAIAIIICHNHPSGNLEPSEEDIKVTKNLKKACNIMNIKLFDHLIISKEGYFSMHHNNLL